MGGAGRHPGLRGREALRPDGPLAAAVPQLARVAAGAHHLDPRRRHHPARPGREDRGQRGPEQHLPRGRAALLAGEVQRPRARPREHDRRGAREDRREGAPAVRLAPGLGGRDQPAQRGRGSAQDDPRRSRCCSSRSWSTARPRAGSTRSSCSSTSPWRRRAA